MRVALIGPPLSGKSSLFTALTERTHETFSGSEILATVHVPDPRLDWLASLVGSRNIVYAAIDFVDMPGFSLASPAEQAEFRRHLPALRQADLLLAVLADFHDPRIPPYRGRVDPRADFNELWSELVFADLEVTTNRLEKLESILGKPSKVTDHDRHEYELLQRVRDALENEQPAGAPVDSSEDRKLLRNYSFLTLKPIVAVVNVDEARAATAEPPPLERAAAALALCARTEADIALLEPADRQAFLADLGLAEPARPRVLRACCQAAGLITFLTATEHEARAWTVPAGTTALEAAGRIHSDMARGFIRAETIPFDTLREIGDFKTARAQGKLRQEGKTYVVQDGDVIHFRFNV